MPCLVRSRGFFAPSIFCLAIIFAAASAAIAQQLAPPVAIKLPPSTNPELDGVLEHGRALESQSRWGEALTYYEDAARKYPGQIVLDERVEVTRIRYDLHRRYADASFRRSLLALSESDALELYNQVLTRIAAHSVASPDWRGLVQRGTTDLLTAMNDPQFVDQHLRGRDEASIRQFRSEALKMSQILPRDRNEAKTVVGNIARTAHLRLGMAQTAVILEYTCGAVGALDEYSTFLTGGQLHDLYSQIDGNFVGLGVELKTQDNRLSLVGVITGSPAERSGLRRGDRIIEVDGQLTSKLTADKAADMLQGAEGTTVDLVVERDGETARRVRVRREQVEVPSVDQVEIVDAASGLGYFKLSAFQKTTASDMDKALWNLHRRGMKSLIIDLRGNPGGLLTASVEAADRFIESGTIVSTRGRNPQEDFIYTAQRAGTWNVPLVVLIDGDSASASEIFAGAMRDHRRATIIGTRSFGKGSVQGIFPLSIANTGIRLTTAKFYSPLGKPYSKVGVEPTLEVRQVAKPVVNDTISGEALAATQSGNPAILAQVAPEDPVLAAAKQVLTRPTAATNAAQR